MKDNPESGNWRVLCELASKEEDSEKLMELIGKVIQALDECNQKSRKQGSEAGIEIIAPPRRSTRADTNTYLYS